MHRLLKITLIAISIFIVSVGVLMWLFYQEVKLEIPVTQDELGTEVHRETFSDSLYICGDSWLHQNDGGLWELYLQGNPYEIGLKNGILTQELSYKQEEEFVKFLNQMIPSKSYLHFLKYFIGWFTKDLDEYIPLEYRKEIYGVSRYASEDFDFISYPYHRMLNLHAAHDVGHAVQNMSLVRCTAFGVHRDSTLLIGRNLDFYAGEGFAKNKVVSFYRPYHGYRFAMVAWAGLIGTLSGMNECGLTVTLNSASSDIPTAAKTPVSIIARKIMQYASTIDEAYAIASECESFVSEMFFIGSAYDSTVAIIEKSLDTTVLFRSGKDYTLLTNHYQSKELKDVPSNVEFMQRNISTYRSKRLEELVNSYSSFTPDTIAAILRDTAGIGGKAIGLCNEKAVNQMIAHHGVIFDPYHRTIYISEFPYQVSKFHAYCLDSVFSDHFDIKTQAPDNDLWSIAEDSVLNRVIYPQVSAYRAATVRMNGYISHGQEISDDTIAGYIALNPGYYEPYYVIAKYYKNQQEKGRAIVYLNRALEHDVVGEDLIKYIHQQIKELEE